MALTRLDCFFHKGSSVTEESSSFVALNPRTRPGEMVWAGSCAARVSLGNQVACKLALQHFVDGVLEYLDSPDDTAGSDQTESCLRVLESAFKNANSSVYSFGHKLAAGGRMAASLLGLVIEDNSIAVGRVGAASAYLARRGELFPFFEPPDPEAAPEALVGSQSMVSVELASVPIEEGDLIFAFSREISSSLERQLLEEVENIASSLDGMVFGSGGLPKSQGQFQNEQGNWKNPCDRIIRQLYPSGNEPEFAMMIVIGPKTIYLQQAA